MHRKRMEDDMTADVKTEFLGELKHMRDQLPQHDHARAVFDDAIDKLNDVKPEFEFDPEPQTN